MASRFSKEVPSFSDEQAALAWILEFGKRATGRIGRGEGELAFSTIADTLKSEGKLDGLDPSRVKSLAIAHDIGGAHSALGEAPAFASPEEAFRWVAVHHSEFVSASSRPLSARTLAALLAASGKVRQEHEQTFCRRCGAYDRYLRNREVFDCAPSFETEEAAFRWLKQNCHAISTRENERQRIALGSAAEMLWVAGKLSDGVRLMALLRMCGAFDLYLHNRELFCSAPEFESKWEAFEWARDNRKAVRPLDRKRKTLSLDSIAAAMEAGGMLRGLDSHSIRLLCYYYDVYLRNRKLFDSAPEFGSHTEAFRWLREVRLRVRPVEERKDGLALGTIAQVLVAAGKFMREGMQPLVRRCGAFDLYVHNEQLMGSVQFSHWKEALAWVIGNRGAVASKDQNKRTLALHTIAQALEAGGRLTGVNMQKLASRCGAYDFIMARFVEIFVLVRDNEGIGSVEHLRDHMRELGKQGGVHPALECLEGGRNVSWEYYASPGITAAANELQEMISAVREGKRVQVCRDAMEGVYGAADDAVSMLRRMRRKGQDAAPFGAEMNRKFGIVMNEMLPRGINAPPRAILR